MASRFECPRCQTVFVKNVEGDAAFVECPSCGALALPAGDATEGMMAAALGGASTSADRPAEISDPARSAPAAQAGIFSGLLEERSDPRLNIPPPALEATEQIRREPASRSEPQARVAPDLDIDWNKDLGDFDFPSLPSTPTQGQAPPARADRAERVPDFPTPRGGTPMPPVTSLPPDAMAALSALTSGSSQEGEPEEEPTENKGGAPWSALSDEAFGDLEKAFDDLALKPQPPPRGKLSKDEERFLRGEPKGGGPPARPPPRRQQKEISEQRPPPRRGAGKSGGPRPTHFQLSDKARQLAFLPAAAVRSEEPSAPVQRPSRDLNEGRPPQRQQQRPPPATAPRTEETDLVREKKDAPPRRKAPSAWSGISAPLVVAVLLVSLALGSGGGAYFLAPKPKLPTPRTHAEQRLADGNKYYDAGRFDDALGAFNAAIKFDPTYAVAYRAKGAALAKLQRFDEAAEAYRAYLMNEPAAMDADDVKAAIARRDKPSESK